MISNPTTKIRAKWLVDNLFTRINSSWNANIEFVYSHQITINNKIEGVYKRKTLKQEMVPSLALKQVCVFIIGFNKLKKNLTKVNIKIWIFLSKYLNDNE